MSLMSSFILFCTLLHLLHQHATQNFVVSHELGDATPSRLPVNDDEWRRLLAQSAPQQQAKLLPHPPASGSLHSGAVSAEPSSRPPPRAGEHDNTSTSDSPAASNVVTKALNREQTRFFIIVGTILAIFVFLYLCYLFCASADELSLSVPYADAESRHPRSNNSANNSNNSADYIVRSASGTVLRSPLPPYYSSDEKSDASKSAPPNYDSSHQHASSGFLAAVAKRLAKKLKRSSPRQSPSEQPRFY